MCCGPWRPVRLETYITKIIDLWAKINQDASLGFSNGIFFAKVDGPASSVHFSLLFEGQVVLDATSPVEDGRAALKFHLDKPKLWHPHGYGEQSLYELLAVPVNQSACGQPVSKKIGFRKVELVQNNDEYGRSFYFRVNNIDIFCGGSCWIPADSFLPSISPSRYRKLLQLMVDGGQVMTR
jgi:beta-mannosidase